MEVQPRIYFKNLKGFQAIADNGKIETALFLDAAKEIVSLIDSFGKLFSPVVYDMNGNIQKLLEIYNKNVIEYAHLDDMLITKEEKIRSRSRDSLIWLKRALELIEKFFSNILKDDSCEENLKMHIEAAYCVTLKQYHSWFIQKSFSVIYGLLPYRSQLVGKGDIHAENMKSLEEFLPSMRLHLEQINIIFTKIDS